MSDPSAESAASVYGVQAELRDDSSVVPVPRPRLSWKVATDEPGWVQTSVRINNGHEEVTLKGPDSVLVEWPFADLAPGERQAVSIKVRSEEGVETGWSKPLRIEAGFLAPGEWIASPVGLDDPSEENLPARVRTEFELGDDVERATLFWTALGVAEPEVNGQKVSDQVLASDRTAYRDRLVHETVDVTGLVSSGKNVLAATMAGGWYTEKYGYYGLAQRTYGDQPSFLAQIRVEFTDGRVQTVAPTGEEWLASDGGSVVSGGFYSGEHQDLRKEEPGWSNPGFDTTGWSPARVGAAALPGYENVPEPEARTAQPIRRIESLPVTDVITSPSGKAILDFGQNLGGRVRIKVNGKSGDQITLHHAEVLDQGELAIRPLRFAEQKAVFDLADGENELEVRFTSFGFRYVQVDGWPGEIDPAAIEAVVLHTDMNRRAWFDCSNPLLNRLHENVVWTLKANSLSIPTDCPQRDERLGFTGDLQLFAPTAATLFDCDAFLSSWLRDLSLEQDRHDGNVPMMIPETIPFGDTDNRFAIYGDASCVIPSVLHERFGNTEVLRRQFESMKAWVGAVLEVAGDSGLWEGTPQLGDWLDPTAPPEDPGRAKADSDLVSTACLFRCLKLVAETAETIGEESDATHYGELAERSRLAFIDTYLTPNGRAMTDAVTAYSMAIAYGIATDPELRQKLGDRLAEVVRRGGYRIATGFVGTPIVTDALTSTGHLAAAERLVNQTECPSWLYLVNMGATTTWERWDSMLPDGTINQGEMTSFNHYAFGSIADWMHRTVAGLAPETPGYRCIRVAPRPFDSLDRARSTQFTPYGNAEVEWTRVEGDQFKVVVTVPPNSTAILDLPGQDEEKVGSGTWERTFTSTVLLQAGSYGIDSTLDELVDDPRAYEALFEVLAECMPDRVEGLRQGTIWASGHPLRSILKFIPPEMAKQIDDALAAVGGETV